MVHGTYRACTKLKEQIDLLQIYYPGDATSRNDNDVTTMVNREINDAVTLFTPSSNRHTILKSNYEPITIIILIFYDQQVRKTK